ncbi:MAG: hypothetical protein EAZ53_07325 [Bacteroidetes bacterium]|nr:MAG: hypothetical protein EAZ53_07325 [Bacteroidota bacterium]
MRINFESKIKKIGKMNTIKSLEITNELLVGLAGVPSIGKTSTLIYATTQWAEKGKKTWFYSISKSKTYVITLAKRNLTEQDWQLFSENVLIIDEIIESPNQLIHFIKGALAVSKPDFILIDTDNFIEISKELRSLALEFNTPIITSSSMETPHEIEENYNPQLNEIQDKSLVQYADKILALSRPSYFGVENENPHQIYLIELLNRNSYTDMEEFIYKKICKLV